MRKRFFVCLDAKNTMKYDIKRGCYIDENMNPLDFVKFFCAGTYKTETKKEVGEEEMNGKCSKCEKSEADNVKLLKNVESLTLENKTLEIEKKAADEQILKLRLNCERLKSENDKLLNDLNSLTSKNKILKEKEKDFESKRKSSENENFWIKLEKKNLKENETKFQEQLNVLKNEKIVLENIKIENEKSIKSHLERISQLENEAVNSRNKIDELEKKLKGFVTSLDFLNIPCPKPISSVPISGKVINFDKVKIEDCDEISDDEKEKKRKIFLDLQDKFKNTILQSTEVCECSMQKPGKKIVKQEQKVKIVKDF
ncbi:hypothetical protein Hanom_Chr10g00905691 [Helianthus anomalus]